MRKTSIKKVHFPFFAKIFKITYIGAKKSKKAIAKFAKSYIMSQTVEPKVFNEILSFRSKN